LYSGVELGQIKKHATGMAKGMFAKQNNIREILPYLFFVPKKDIFILVLRARSAKEPKINKYNDFFGVEFKYDPTVKHKIIFNKNAFVILENTDKKVQLGNVLTHGVVSEHSSAFMAIKHYL
jgi:hypothetical protein